MIPRSGRGVVVGVGALGWAQVYLIEGNRTIGRNESRAATLLPADDYFKLQIVFAHIAILGRAIATGGIRLVPVGVVGRDTAGRRVVRELRSWGLDSSLVSASPERPTSFGIACQYPDGSTFNLGNRNGAAEALTPELSQSAVRSLRAHTEIDVAVALPEVPLETRLAFLRAVERPATRIGAFLSAEVEPAVAAGHLKALDVIALNEDEAGALVGRAFRPARRASFLRDLAKRAASLNPRLSVVMTAGQLGAFCWSGGAWDHCPAPAVEIVSSTGAGDTLLAGVVAGLWAGLPLSQPPLAGRALWNRGLGSAIDVGVLAAAWNLGQVDTISPRTTAAAIGRFGRQLGLELAPGARWLRPSSG